MICPQCSADISADSAFCPKCGQQVTGSAAANVPRNNPTPRERFQQSAADKRTNSADGDVEHTLWSGGFSPNAMIGYWLLAGLVTIAAIVAGVLLPRIEVWVAGLGISVALWLAFLGYFAYQRLSIEYTLTSQRLIHKNGLLRRRADRVEVIDIDDVTYEQGFVERMVGVGKIRILSSDASDPQLFLLGIGDVQRVANLIDDTRREERRKRSMYIESV